VELNCLPPALQTLPTEQQALCDSYFLLSMYYLQHTYITAKIHMFTPHSFSQMAHPGKNGKPQKSASRKDNAKKDIHYLISRNLHWMSKKNLVQHRENGKHKQYSS